MHTKVAVTLTPKPGKIVPEVFISVPGQCVREVLYESKKIKLEFDAPVGWLEIVFMNKPDDDADLAVIIDQIEFFGISDPKFVWAGNYTPSYPEPWYSQQIEKPPKSIPQQNYLGWNGKWRLEFSVPVFTWIHQVQNLGWLYQ
jgi:hypothetical protein